MSGEQDISAEDLLGVCEVAISKAYPKAIVYADGNGAVVVLTEDTQRAVGILPVSLKVIWS